MFMEKKMDSGTEFAYNKRVGSGTIIMSKREVILKKN